MAHGLVHFAAVAKAHLDFGGVHVDVHPRGVDLDVQRIHRLAVAVQHVFVGAARGVRDHLVAHKAAVDIAKLLVGARAGGVWNASAAPHAHGQGVVRAVGAALVVHPHRALDKVCAQHIGQALLQRGQRYGLGVGAAPLLNQPPFVPDGKAHVWPGQRMATHGFHAMGELGGIGF